jgi:hypothetical protein
MRGRQCAKINEGKARSRTVLGGVVELRAGQRILRSTHQAVTEPSTPWSIKRVSETRSEQGNPNQRNRKSASLNAIQKTKERYPEQRKVAHLRRSEVHHFSALCTQEGRVSRLLELGSASARFREHTREKQIRSPRQTSVRYLMQVGQSASPTQPTLNQEPRCL